MKQTFLNGVKPSTSNPLPFVVCVCVCVLIFIFLAVESIQASEKRKPTGYWNDIRNCRRFLEEIAKEKGFDPLDFHSWDSLGYTEILKRVSDSFLHLHATPRFLTIDEICRVVQI